MCNWLISSQSDLDLETIAFTEAANDKSLTTWCTSCSYLITSLVGIWMSCSCCIMLAEERDITSISSQGLRIGLHSNLYLLHCWTPSICMHLLNFELPHFLVESLVIASDFESIYLWFNEIPLRNFWTWSVSICKKHQDINKSQNRRSAPHTDRQRKYERTNLKND